MFQEVKKKKGDLRIMVYDLKNNVARSRTYSNGDKSVDEIITFLEGCILNYELINKQIKLTHKKA